MKLEHIGYARRYIVTWHFEGDSPGSIALVRLTAKDAADFEQKNYCAIDDAIEDALIAKIGEAARHAVCIDNYVPLDEVEDRVDYEGEIK